MEAAVILRSRLPQENSHLQTVSLKAAGFCPILLLKAGQAIKYSLYR